MSAEATVRRKMNWDTRRSGVGAGIVIVVGYLNEACKRGRRCVVRHVEGMWGTHICRLPILVASVLVMGCLL